MTTRRDFIRATALGATAATVLPDRLPGAPAAASSPTPRSPTPGRSPHPLAANHRNLFNGDTCVFFYNPEKWQPEGGPFSAKAIHRYVEILADSGIDTFVINANASRAWYPSKVIPGILDGYRRGDREFFRGHAICANLTEPAAIEKYLDDSVVFMNRYQDLLDAGVDWLAETATAWFEYGRACAPCACAVLLRHVDDPSVGHERSSEFIESWRGCFDGRLADAREPVVVASRGVDKRRSLHAQHRSLQSAGAMAGSAGA